MKRFFSVFSFILALAITSHAETVNYYVSTTGNDTNDGLTSENALATVDSAMAYIHDDFAGGVNNDYTIMIDSGLYDVANIVINNDSKVFTINLVGSGADKTTITGNRDSTNISNQRLFANLNANNSNVTINVSKLKAYNYGVIPTAQNATSWGGMFFNENASAIDVNISVDECIIEKVSGNYGTIFSTNNTTTTFTLTNTYLTDVSSICVQNRFHSPIRLAAGKMVINNCVFNNFKQDHLNSNQQIKTKWGTVISGIQGKTATASTEFTFVNNTIINDSAVNMSKTWYDKSSVCFIDVSENEFSSKLTIANNIFMTGQKTFEGTVGTADGSTEATKNYRSIIFTAGATAQTEWLVSSNNVMVSSANFPEAGNTIDDMLTYTSPELAFVMDGDLPEVFTADNGLMYVKAEGTAIVDAALASVAPMYDIAGFERSATPTIGAYEGSDATAISEVSTVVTSLYPNPVTDVLNVKGDVAQLAVYSLAGQSAGIFQVNNQQVNLSMLPQGIYLVKSINAEGISIATTQLIKK